MKKYLNKNIEEKLYIFGDLHNEKLIKRKGKRNYILNILLLMFYRQYGFWNQISISTF